MSPASDYWTLRVGDYVYRNHLTLTRAATIASELMQQVNEIQLIQETPRWGDNP